MLAFTRAWASRLAAPAVWAALAAPLGAQVSPTPPVRSSPPPLGSVVIPGDSGVLNPTSTGTLRQLLDTATATFSHLDAHVTTVAPGSALHSAHRHVEEELVFVQRGTLEVRQDGIVRRAGPGSLIFEATGALHGLRNVGPDSVTYLVLRIAPRTTRPDSCRIRPTRQS